jgi:hypothetical protein
MQNKKSSALAVRVGKTVIKFLSKNSLIRRDEIIPVAALPP